MDKVAIIPGGARTGDPRAQAEGETGGNRRGSTLLRDAVPCKVGDHARARRAGGGERMMLNDRPDPGERLCPGERPAPGDRVEALELK